MVDAGGNRVEHPALVAYREARLPARIHLHRGIGRSVRRRQARLCGLGRLAALARSKPLDCAGDGKVDYRRAPRRIRRGGIGQTTGKYTDSTGDWFAVIAPLGIMLGRIGCILNGCCLGTICAPAWFTMNDSTGTPRWPAAPVELLFNALMLGCALILRRFRVLRGQHFHVYLVAYGSFRFVHEFVRDTPRIAGSFSGYQIAALAVAGLGAAGFLLRRRQACDRRPERTDLVGTGSSRQQLI